METMAVAGSPGSTSTVRIHRWSCGSALLQCLVSGVTAASGPSRAWSVVISVTAGWPRSSHNRRASSVAAVKVTR